VLVDTNGWLLPARSGLDLAAAVGDLLPEAELAVPRSVLAELDQLVQRGVPGASVGRSIADTVRVVPTRATGDAGVEEAARRPGRYVLTADRLLAARLRRQGVAVLVPRDRDRLELRRAEPRATDSATVKNRGPLVRGGRRRRPER
jgi:rRNA-processing protein FCF1